METQWLTSSEQESWRSVLRFAVELLDGLTEDLARLGIDHADYEVLVHLSEAEGHRLRMTDLAARVLVSKSRLTYRVDRMVEAGWIRRERCESDRRGWFAVVTPQGLRTLRRIAPHHVASVREMLIDRLTASEFAQLGRLAAKVCDS